MKKVKFLSMAILSMLSFQAFAIPSDLTNIQSLIKCEEAATVSDAATMLNETLSQEAALISRPDGKSPRFYRIEYYIGSQPTITKLDNGRVSICVTLTVRKK